MKKKILYYKFYDGGSEFYRLKPLEYIDTHELTLVECRDVNLNFQLLDSFDTIFILRPQGEVAINLIKTAKRWHKKVIIDWDDSPLSLNQFNPLYSQYETEKTTTIQCLILADEIWVSTAAIKTAFRLYNKNIHVIPNAHDDFVFPVRDKRCFTYNKIASYRGGESHYGDMYELGTPEKIIAMVNGNQDWKFAFYGQRFHYLEKRCGDNYISYSGGWPMVEFQKIIQEQNACIAFYPLATDAFNKSKSNIFFIENTYAGSAVFGNKELPEYSKDCIGDLSELEACIHDAGCLKTLNDLSWEYIQENLLLSKVNRLRIERLLSI